MLGFFFRHKKIIGTSGQDHLQHLNIGAVYNNHMLGVVFFYQSINIGAVRETIVVFFSLSFAQKLKGHVAVNILVDRLHNKPRRFFDAFNFLISIIFLLLIAWMSISQGIELLHSNRVSGNLTIPVYPFFFILAFGCVAMALELLRDLITSIRGIVK